MFAVVINNFAIESSILLGLQAVFIKYRYWSVFARSPYLIRATGDFMQKLLSKRRRSSSLNIALRHAKFHASILQVGEVVGSAADDVLAEAHARGFGPFGECGSGGVHAALDGLCAGQA